MDVAQLQPNGLEESFRKRHTTAVRVHEGHDTRAYRQPCSFDICERDMARVVRRWAVEDGEGPS